MQTTYINIETNDDASYDKAYNEYNTKNNFIDMMVIDLRRGVRKRSELQEYNIQNKE